MNISAAGIAAIKQREGFKLRAYQDTRKIWTIGVGHTGPDVKRGVIWSEPHVDAILVLDLQKFENAVNMAAKNVLTQNQFDACVSLAFNIGVQGFIGSSVVKQINSGNMQAAADDFLMWEKPPELKARREGEWAQFLGEGSYAAA
jgi:lysozyme